jgi:hypothetical protein
MAYIVQNLLVPDTRLQLGCEEILRTMNFGIQWTKVRLGIRFFVQGGSAFNGGSLYGGVCQGNKGYSAVDCTDVLAAWFGASSNMPSVGWIYGTNTFTVNSGVNFVRKVGAVWTANQATGSYPVTLAAQPATNVLNSVYWDFTKLSASTVQCSQWAPYSTSASVNMTRYNHLASMENELSPGTFSSAYYQNTTPAMSVAGSSQLWDTVFVGWGRTCPNVEIHDITVLRFY